MKKKVGIITIYDLNNYGNRLQNYALYKCISNLGFSVNTFTFMPLNNVIPREQYFRWMFHEYTNYIFKNNRNEWKEKKGRQFAFKQFTKEYIPTIQCTEDELNNNADYFIVGSDQVWNPSWFSSREMHWYLLTDIEDSKKRCFSPSFGIESFPEKYRELYSDALLSFQNPSAREMSGVNIIKDLTGKNAVQIIDPTLLLSKHDWTSIQRRPRNISLKNKYILQYFLGDIPEQAIKDKTFITDKHSFKSYTFLDKNEPDVYACGPREFIYMISHASLVLTDSFHACVFSFLFNIPFIVYDRNDNAVNMSTRITDFLNQFSLKDRSQFNVKIEDALNCNYSEGKSILEKKKEQAFEYLKTELN